jgi:hypothetical protein
MRPQRLPGLVSSCDASAETAWSRLSRARVWLQNAAFDPFGVAAPQAPSHRQLHGAGVHQRGRLTRGAARASPPAAARQLPDLHRSNTLDRPKDMTCECAQAAMRRRRVRGAGVEGFLILSAVPGIVCNVSRQASILMAGARAMWFLLVQRTRAAGPSCLGGGADWTSHEKMPTCAVASFW